MGAVRHRRATLADFAASLSGSCGENRLVAVAKCLTDVFDASFALVAEVRNDDTARVVAFSGDIRPDFPGSIPLAGTAFARVLEQGSASCPAEFARLFPEDARIRELGVESFYGRVLHDFEGSPVGLIAAMDRGSMDWDADAEALVSLLAFPAELEICRLRTQSGISRVARQWAAAVDTIPDFVAVIDADFRFQRVNQALARFAGVHPRELVGRKCHEVFHGLDHPWPGCPHEQSVRTGRSVVLELSDPHIGVPLLVTCAPFFGDGGELVGSVHIARDISEQKRATQVQEELIAKLRETLSRVKTLSGLLPICAVCKKIRDDQGYWEQLEVYFRDRTDAIFSHGLCPGCARQMYPDYYHG